MGKPSIERFEIACVDCGICYVACQYQAVKRIRDTIPRKQITIVVDRDRFAVPERVTVKRALELLGLSLAGFRAASRFLLLARLVAVLPVLC